MLSRSPSPEVPFADIIEPVERAEPIHGDAPLEDTQYIPASIDATDLDFEDEPGQPSSPSKLADAANSPEPPAPPPKSPVSQSLPDSTTASAPEPEQRSGPVRQVRSSWLRQALGTDTVPVSDIDGNGLRKSVAATQRPQVDFTLRKSLATGMGAKRPSEDANEDEEKRPEKVFKFDGRQSVATGSLSHTPGPSVAPQPSSVPHIDAASGQMSTQQIRADTRRSDIHKVTKALDELRERAALREAQKAKAASVAGPRHTLHDRQSVTGGSLFRGIGNISSGLGKSLGLGGTARSAEEEALRLQAELEADRLAEAEAQAELDQLMSNFREEHSPTKIVDNHEDEAAKKDDDVAPKESSTDQSPAEPVAESREIRATTVELQDESIVAGALETNTPADSPAPVLQAPAPLSPLAMPSMSRQATPNKQPLDVFESTTPMASPPKRLFKPAPAPRAPQLQSKVAESPKQSSATQAQAQPAMSKARQPTPEADEEEMEVDLPELPQPESEEVDERTDAEDDAVREMPAKKMFKSNNEVSLTVGCRCIHALMIRLGDQSTLLRAQRPAWLLLRSSLNQHRRRPACLAMQV